MIDRIRDHINEIGGQMDLLEKRMEACAVAADKEGMAKGIDEFADKMKDLAKYIRSLDQEEFEESLWEIQ